MLLCAVVTMALAATLGQTCSPENFPASKGFDATMYEADVVLLGQVQNLNLEGTDNIDVTFSVDCVYKSGNSTNKIGSNVIVDGRYKLNSCTTTYMEQNGRYLLALHNMGEDGKYHVFELNIASRAAYKEGDVDFAALVRLCGFEEPRDIAVDACAMPDADNECVVAADTAAASSTTTMWVLLLTSAAAFLALY